MMNNSLIGVVLCGGDSTRMGRDKGLIRQRNISWAEQAFQKLQQLTSEVYVSINARQAAEYGKIFLPDRLIIDSVESMGPLTGLLSVHKRMPECDIFLLACDMVNMDVEMMKALSESYKKFSTQHDFYVYTNAGKYEPLAGIYRSEGIKRVLSEIENTSFGKRSMKHVLETGKTFAIEISDHSKAANVNSLSDLQK
jgi:molybdopterin-guanine dinucleotide biosynthesis protein A